MEKLYGKVKKGLADMAIQKFVKSEYLRDTTTVLPLTFLTISVRGVLNFLIVSRLQTGFYLFDFLFSVCVTVTLTLLSPSIYNHFSKIYETEVKDFSQIIIDSYWEEGTVFVETWRTRIFGTLGFLIIFLLFFIEINSKDIQEFIFHMMVSSSIVDHLTKLRDQNKVNVKIYEKPSSIVKHASYNNLEILERKKEILGYEIIEDYSLNNYVHISFSSEDDSY